jgi:hypothetical protein
MWYGCRAERKWYLEMDRQTLRLSGQPQQDIIWRSANNFLTMKVRSVLNYVEERSMTTF